MLERSPLPVWRLHQCQALVLPQVSALRTQVLSQCVRECLSGRDGSADLPSSASHRAAPGSR